MPRVESPVATALQDQIDQSSRAQERIDTDPGEARDVLVPLVEPTAGELTMQDMFRLFLQLQQQQSSMQSQLVEMLSHQGQQQQARMQAHTREEISLMQEQQRATLEAWKTEPRLPVFIQPSEDEKKVFAVMGEFPPRIKRINGLEFPIRVGEVVNVPESIHAEITWAQTYAGKRTRPAQSIASIGDPQRGQFLAGSQSVSPGRDGVVGEGPLLVVGLPRTPEAAGPLDVRYDHEGR